VRWLHSKQRDVSRLRANLQVAQVGAV